MSDSLLTTSGRDRRGFLKRCLAAVVGAALGLVPVGAGLVVFLDPLRRKSAGGGALPVATLDAIPDDGVPRKFELVASRIDGWSKLTRVPVGAVYLRRTSDGGL